MSIARKYLFLTILISALLVSGLGILLLGSYSQIQALEARVNELETLANQEAHDRAQAIQMAGPGAATSPADQQVKDLSTRFVGDSRTLSEKLRDFTADNPDAQHLAIACKVVADLAENSDALSNDELRWLYQTQTNTDLKRIIAQVLSLRGDNQLLDSYIAKLQSGLVNPAANERRKTLGELGKTRYAGAAKLIVPLLVDEDTSVVLDALLALRITGNETQLPAVEKLLKHPDESVRWLAGDAANNLQMLSKKARTLLIMPDIVAEIPPISM